jgi:hypothetical protein
MNNTNNNTSQFLIFLILLVTAASFLEIPFNKEYKIMVAGVFLILIGVLGFALGVVLLKSPVSGKIAARILNIILIVIGIIMILWIPLHLDIYFKPIIDILKYIQKNYFKQKPTFK